MLFIPVNKIRKQCNIICTSLRVYIFAYSSDNEFHIFVEEKIKMCKISIVHKK